MATRNLEAGYVIQEKQVLGTNNTKNLYPITRAQNVFMSDGYDVETTIANVEDDIEDIAANYVPRAWLGKASAAGVIGVATLDANGKVISTQLADATSSVHGAVKIADTLAQGSSGDSDTAASTVMVAGVMSEIDALEDDIAANYVAKAQLGVATVAGGEVGVATLDTSGTVPTTQLPTATSSAQGALKITNTLNASALDDANDVAASEKLARTIKDSVDTLAADVAANYVAKTQIGAAAASGEKGVAELDSNALVPTTQLPTGTSSAQGALKITNALNASALDDANDVAASEKLARTLQNEIDSIETDFVPRAWLGVASASGVIGVATLDTNGLVPATQLPGFVDDIVDAVMGTPSEGVISTATYAHDDDYGHHAGDTIVPSAGKIYLDVNTNNTYRWSTDRYVLISESLALGVTHSNAFYGDWGQIAYRHATNLNPTTGEAETNHNPHGLTETDIATILGYVPVHPTDLVIATGDSGATNGLFRADDYASFKNMQEIIVSANAPTFASGKGLWFEIVEDETVTP